MANKYQKKGKKNYRDTKSVKANSAKQAERKEPSYKWVAAVGHWLPVAYAVLFAVFAFYMLSIKNADYLYAVQERSLFLFDSSFYDMVMVKPGALMTYLGCFFTQFFYHPALGSLMLIGIWLIIYFFTIKAFRLDGWWSCLALIPIGALLCSEVILGYWLYYNKVWGYWFAPSIGLLINMLAIWMAGTIRRKSKWAEAAFIAIWCIVGYILTGWLGLLATLVMSLQGITSAPKSRILPLCVSIVCIIAVPIIAYQFYDQMRINDAWIVGLPLFQQDAYTSTRPLIPFIAIAVALPAFGVIWFHPVLAKPKKGRVWAMCGLQVACIALITGCVCKSNFNDYNYHAELRIYRAAEEGRWNDILTEAVSNPTGPTREIILFQNIALTYLGELGDHMFKYNNMSIPPVVYDSLNVHMVQTNAPLVYILYARTNFATRWSIENAVEYGYSPTIYKTLTIAAILSKEYDLAEKYLKTLKKTLYYGEWADKYLPVIKDHSLRDKMPELANMREYYDHYSSRLDSDEGLVEMYLLNYFSNTMNKDSKLLQETTLVYAMLSKDIQLFWPRFFLYAYLHKGEQMPIHYQEAAYLYGHLEHEVDISTMPFDQQRIVQRYASFNQLTSSLAQQGKSSEQIGEVAKASFGDTFWWFYFFCRGLSSY